MRRIIGAALLLAAVFFIGALSADAASATIHKVWLEHGTKLNNRPVMKVHSDFTVNGKRGQKCYMNIFIQRPDGQWLKVNGNRTTSDGVSYFSWEFKPDYDGTRYSDMWYAPYLDDLRLPAGKHTYKVFVTISDFNGTMLGQSDGSHTFDGTGSSGGGGSDNYNNKNYNNNNSNNNNGVVKKWREELGYGGFVICTQFVNGSIMRVRYRPCPNCNGSQVCPMCYGQGVCSMCHGQGGIVSAGYGTFIPCALCNRTGRCGHCGGSGRCNCTTMSEYPGYAIGSTSTIMPDGTTNRESYEYNNGTGRKSDSYSGNKKQTCPDCGGTRLWRRGKSPEYAQPNSQLVGYYNSAGQKCPHCGYVDRHWHSKCATCKHYYGTDNPYR